ncbi:unnamed protein product [Miscanthus lutarioriparius]|uniref:Protein kinase domain-containing protein n=1 Tax=Miscanthus lutarioriparius TaxID=422564 RepID=A0A811QDG4_9POAL|nr:unnamed protein product [Miscanthus lutarioriparius]
MANLQSQPSLASTLPTNLPVTFMKEITKDFSVDRVLGQSVFGTVYQVKVKQGVLPEGGRMIAVKRLAENAPVPAGITFGTEVTNLMALKHENIVELVHYCHESQKKVVQHNGRYVIVDVIESCLCYKYLPKLSLDKYVYDEQIMYKHPLLDPNGLQQVKACIIIGLKCVEADRNKRPSIADIVDKLNGKRVPIFDQVSLPSMHETLSFQG